MSSAWIIWLTLWGFSLGDVTDSARSDILMSSVSDAVRSGATLVSRFLSPKTSTFLPFVFQKLSERIKRLDKAFELKDEAKENELILIMLKLMGVDLRKVSDFAFNGMISLVLLAVRLLMQMQDPDLVDLILQESKKKFRSNAEEDVECIRLLICRTKPFVRGMQRSLRFFLKREKIEISDDRVFEGRAHEESCKDYDEAAWEAANLEDRMYFFAPTMREVVESGDQCDQLFPDCLY